MRLVRDVVFGVLDYEILTSLASQEIKGATSDFEDILNLILPMISINASPKPAELDKRNRILRAAERVFADKGYNQVTISEIAKLSRVSEGTIYEYFESKEHLLLSVPEQRLRHNIEQIEEIFEIKTPLRKLKRLIRYHFSLYLTERNFLKVFLLHIQLHKRFYHSPIFEIYRQYTQIIEEIIEEGKAEGSMRSNINARVFRNLFLGTFSHMALRWLILGTEQETDKMKEIDEIVSLLTRAVVSHAEDSI